MRRQRGVVLIVVLWVVSLLTVLLAAFSLSARVERHVASDVMLGVEARASAHAVLNYLAALYRMGYEELPEMPGEVFELVLNERLVRFRLVPENSFVSLFAADADTLEKLFVAMGVDNPEQAADRLLALREQAGLEQDSAMDGEEIVVLRQFDQVMRLLELDPDTVQQYRRWFSLDHEEPVDLRFAAADLQAALDYEPTDGGEEEQAVADMGGMLRVQVELSDTASRRKIEATAVFGQEQAGYQIVRWNEYNAIFTLD